MKYLNQFCPFDCAAFFADKRIQVVGSGVLTDYTTKQPVGTKVDVVIVEDKTIYRQKDGEQGSNLYEKLTVKVEGKTVTVPIGAEVALTNPTAVIFGEYRNKLSVRADDVKVVADAKA